MQRPVPHFPTSARALNGWVAHAAGAEGEPPHPPFGHLLPEGRRGWWVPAPSGIPMAEGESGRPRPDGERAEVRGAPRVRKSTVQRSRLPVSPASAAQSDRPAWPRSRPDRSGSGSASARRRPRDERCGAEVPVGVGPFGWPAAGQEPPVQAIRAGTGIGRLVGPRFDLTQPLESA
jgi:hypothetical protein